MTVVTLDEAKTRIEELANRAARGQGIRIVVDGGVRLELRPATQVLPKCSLRRESAWADNVPGLLSLLPISQGGSIRPVRSAAGLVSGASAGTGRIKGTGYD